MQIRSNIDNIKKPQRLKKRRDFVRIQRAGLRFKGKFVVVMTPRAFASGEDGRFGLVTPKAIGKAHDRNKVKRRLRHIISDYVELFVKRDFVVLATSCAVAASFEDLKNDVFRAASQLAAQKTSTSRIKQA